MSAVDISKDDDYKKSVPLSPKDIQDDDIQAHIDPSQTSSSTTTTTDPRPNPTPDDKTKPYTTWTTPQRHLLVCLLGYLSLASSLTANIYFPLLDLLSHRYSVTTQQINLTITIFFIFQGIAPSFWSPLSDTLGRRPVYLATFTIYTIASAGLSFVDKNYAALMVLRALQSVGGSAVLSLAYAAVADVTVHSERGKFLAPMLTATNVGPCIGPVIGGGAALASGSDPRWCFRALLVFGCSAVGLIAVLMPETLRSIVGNGSVEARGVWRSWWAVLRGRLLGSGKRRKEKKGNMEKADGHGRVGIVTSRGEREEAAEEVAEQQEEEAKPTGHGRFVMPNPLPSLRIVFHPDTFLTLWMAGAPYALWFCVQTSITPVFSLPRSEGGTYGYNPLQVGCCFLAGGVGIILGGFIAGRLMDVNYKHVAKKVGLQVDKVRGDDVARFPIEKARSRGSIRIILVSMWAVVGYGWAVDRELGGGVHVHAAVPLLLQGYLGCKCTVIHQIYSALIVDVFPKRTGTAAAANNITRCSLAAGAVAMLDPLVRALGYGWVFTLLGVFEAATCVAAVVALRRWGRWWRDERRAREEQLLV